MTDRRRFLLQSIALSSAPFVVRGKNNKPFRVGVIGHTGRGNFGHGLDSVWKLHPRTTIAGIADAEPNGLKRAQAKLKEGKAYADYREMLDKERPDFVAVCPRHVDQRVDMIKAACEFGAKGIYVEKPFARSLEECDWIKEACAKSDEIGGCPPQPLSPGFGHREEIDWRRSSRKSGRPAGAERRITAEEAKTCGFWARTYSTCSMPWPANLFLVPRRSARKAGWRASRTSLRATRGSAPSPATRCMRDGGWKTGGRPPSTASRGMARGRRGSVCRLSGTKGFWTLVVTRSPFLLSQGIAMGPTDNARGLGPVELGRIGENRNARRQGNGAKPFGRHP